VTAAENAAPTLLDQLRELDQRGDASAAVALCDRSGDRLRPAEPGPETVRLLYECAGAYHDTGAPGKAGAFLHRALKLAEELGDQEGQALALQGLGNHHKYRGEIDAAIDAFRRSLGIFQRLRQPEWITALRIDLGVTLRQIGRPEEALDVLGQAREDGWRRGDDQTLGIALTQIAAAKTLLGQQSAAITNLDQALLHRRNAGDRRGEATTLAVLGSTYQELGDFERALDHHRQALAIYEELEQSRYLTVTLGNVGWIHLEVGDEERAREHFERALGLLETTPDADTEAHVRAGLALVARREGDLDGAVGSLRAALDRVETVRASTPQSLGAAYFSRRQGYYDLLVELLMERHRRDPTGGFAARAFHAAERARARQLLDLLAIGSSLSRGGASPELRRREEELQEQIAAAELRRMTLVEGPSEAELDEIEATLRQRLLEYTFLRADLLGRPGPGDTSSAAAPEPLELPAVQQLIDADTTLLAYRLGETRSYLWRIDARSFEVFELEAREKIEREARLVLRLLQRSRFPQQQERIWQVAARLSPLLLGPVAGRLGTDRLVVVGDGILQYLPFAALPRPGGDEGPADPLVEEHEIVQLPSASVLATLRRRDRRPATGGVAVVADPVFGAGDPRVAPERGVDADADPLAPSFPRLPGTGREAEAILELAPPGDHLALLGFDATRARLEAADLGRYRILHFATHGLAHALHPELSALALTRVDRHGHPTDGGFLRMHELPGRRLAAELVVLSACRTALGPELRGEGPVGLPQGFLTAGASRVVVSLWNVEDDATTELMTAFYRGIFEHGLPPAAALRRAQLAMLRHPDERLRAPYYWAAFVLQGEWRGIDAR
jgi:CHAT domain-containing protein